MSPPEEPYLDNELAQMARQVLPSGWGTAAWWQLLPAQPVVLGRRLVEGVMAREYAEALAASTNLSPESAAQALGMVIAPDSPEKPPWLSDLEIKMARPHVARGTPWSGV